MADFNNTNLADFSGVWVFCEQRQGELQPTVLELISEARKLADDMGTEVCGLLLGGKGVGEKMAKELGAYGADKVLVCESDLLETYTTDAYAKVLCDTVMAKKPEILLIAATNIGLKGSPTNIFKSFTPPQKGQGKMLEGADKATCDELVAELQKKHII